MSQSKIPPDDIRLKYQHGIAVIEAAILLVEAMNDKDEHAMGIANKGIQKSVATYLKVRNRESGAQTRLDSGKNGMAEFMRNVTNGRGGTRSTLDR